jgi:hypothetical protein
MRAAGLVLTKDRLRIAERAWFFNDALELRPASRANFLFRRPGRPAGLAFRPAGPSVALATTVPRAPPTTAPMGPPTIAPTRAPAVPPTTGRLTRTWVSCFLVFISNVSAVLTALVTAVIADAVSVEPAQEAGKVWPAAVRREVARVDHQAASPVAALESFGLPDDWFRNGL